MRDTRGSARDRYHELLRGQAPHERAAQTMSLSQMVRELAVAGLRQSYPDAPVREINVRLTVRLYGRSAAERIFGSVPDDAR